MRSRRSAPSSSVVAWVVLSAVAGCSTAEDAAPDPSRAAEALAAALAAGDLGDLAVDGMTHAEAQASYDQTVGGLVAALDAGPAVEAVGVRASEDGTAATATLRWTWPVAADEEWTYEAEAPLVLAGDEWRVTWEPAVVEPSLAADEVLDATPVTAARGDVTGADGATLVTDRPVVTVGVDRSRVPLRLAVAAAGRLARLADVDVAPYVERVRAAGARAFVDAITYRRDDVPLAVARAVTEVPGLLAVPGERPLAPTREFAAPLLGQVGPVTAEMLAEDPSLGPGDTVGLSGLQARYDEQLRGTDGLVVDAVAPDGAERELARVDPVAGEPLALTLDPALQLEAEQLLADVRPASAVVALRPSDGALLAAANGPGNGGYDVATYGRLAPGSTFKVVSSLALLRAGLTPASTVSCPPSLTVDGKRFTNYSDYPVSALGEVTLATAVAHSCNTAFISERDRVGDGVLAAAAASLGLGVDHDLGFPAFLGSVEPPTSETGAAADLIGQGTVLASPMAVAAVMASVQRGQVVVPRLVEQVEVAPPDGVEPLTEAEADALRGMLRGVVTSGSGRALADVPGPPVLAKTGTAEFVRDGEVLTHAWMVAGQADLAVAVLVDVGDSGSSTAGPLLEAFLRAAGRTGG